MDHHIIEDTAGYCYIRCRWWLRIAGSYVDVMRIANLAFLHCISNCLVVVVEAAVETYLELYALLFYQCQQLLDLLDIIVDRLLAEYILASLYCFHGNLAMGIGGRANHNYVNVRIVYNVHVVGGCIGDAALCQPLTCAGLIQHRICCSYYLSAVDVVEQIVDVQLTNSAAANYAKL